MTPEEWEEVKQDQLYKFYRLATEEKTATEENTNYTNDDDWD